MSKITEILKSQEEEFENIRCEGSGVGLRTDDQKTVATYNIHKCKFCGRKWHINEHAPICEEFRKKYPDEKSFIQFYNAKIIEAVEREMEKEIQEIISKFSLGEEKIIKGQRFLQAGEHNTLYGFGYPYPDTKEKYVIRKILEYFNSLKE